MTSYKNLQVRRPSDHFIPYKGMKVHDLLTEAACHALSRSANLVDSLEPWITHVSGPQNNKSVLHDAVDWLESFISFFDDDCYQLLIDVVPRRLAFPFPHVVECVLSILEVMEILDGKKRRVIENKIKHHPATMSISRSEVGFWKEILANFGVAILSHQSNKSNPRDTIVSIWGYMAENAETRGQKTKSEPMRRYFKTVAKTAQDIISSMVEDMNEEKVRKNKSINRTPGRWVRRVIGGFLNSSTA